MSKLKLLFMSIAVAALAACGAEEETNKGKTPTAETVAVEETNAEAAEFTIVDALGNEHVFDEAPEAIATLNPGELDVLVSLEANVVGRPEMSTKQRAEVESIQTIGNPHNPSFEQIAALGADVLIVPPSFAQFEQTVEAQGTTVVYSNPETIEDILGSVELIGTMLHKEDEAAALVEQLQGDIDALSGDSEVRALMVYGAGNTFLAALPQSLPGAILEASGGVNIAAEFEATEKYPSYASLSPELIVAQNPQAIFLLTHSDPVAVQAAFEQQMNTNATWKNLDAVKNDKFYVLPADLFGNNPGTRIVESVQYMINALNDIQ